MAPIAAEKKPNRLIREISPYLLQHAYNPVDWYPWGPEALERARKENKPIFLSIGYTACHWCHVMERESFADEQTAKVMNAAFICIKVDREERPDLDHIYQNSCQLLTGQGGWPLSVFLTPDLRPFYAGTYFPPSDSYGRPGFRRVLVTLRDLYRDAPERVAEAAARVTTALIASEDSWGGAIPAVPHHNLVDQGVEYLASHFDEVNGGFGSAPKFPNAPCLALFLQQGEALEGDWYAEKALFTLRKMAAGGIHDHLGGGFHRYSTDARWHIPHFEKMLYDNALLPQLYLAAYQQTGDDLYSRVAVETLEYALREMRSPDGAFYAAQDADSEGVEGKYYVWSMEELQSALGEQDARLFAKRYGVADESHFANNPVVLRVAVSRQTMAADFNLSCAELDSRLETARKRLLAFRGQREAPFIDRKVLAGWNGLMVSALARAAFVLGRVEYKAAAVQALRFIDHELMLPDGRLLRSWQGRPGKQAGFLEDYIYVCQGLVDMYEATFASAYLDRACSLLQLCIELFWDDKQGGFYLTKAADDLIHRVKDAHDQSLPSANGMAARVLLRLHSYIPNAGFQAKAEQIFGTFSRDLENNPWGTATLLSALDVYHAGIADIVVVSPAPHVSPTDALLAVLRRHYLPNAALYGMGSAASEAHQPEVFQGKIAVDGKSTVYVCRNHSCRPPITDPDILRTELAQMRQPAL